MNGAVIMAVEEEAQLIKMDTVSVDHEEGNYATSEVPHENKTTLKALILSKDVGALIGKAGATIREMREQTNCRIMISDSIPQVHERVLTVIGSVEMVGRAYALIADQIEREAKQHDPNVSRVFVNLLVPNQQTGAIIGKGGARIKEIRDQSGAQISVATESLPQSNERLVTVMGDAKAIGGAVSTIVVVLHENPCRGTVVPFRPQVRLEQIAYSAPWGAGYAAYPEGHVQSGYVYQNGAASTPQQRGSGGHTAREGQSSQIVPIPSDFVGAIIGKAGSRINEIRHMTGTYIKIEDAPPGTPERHVVITGTKEGCQSAAYLVQTRLQEEMSRRVLQGQALSY